MTALEDQARSIFLAALERAPEEWPEMLAEACGDNAELRAHVESLLAAHQALGSIHGGGAETPTRTIEQPVLERRGTQIGPYKLMEQIGEGGMGLVFVAEQHAPVRRKVALKVIKPGMDTRDVIARFEAERQALALMDHPNIARVLDAGATASGRPYFVMELVKGTPITEYCDENRLSPRERLELFTHVCHAVQHAHQKGIIHRDIKPSNVLVASHDGQPVAKVIDFGVAKAIGQQLTERTIYTALTQMVGTPLYMSPEQAGMSSLDIDTRTDIYSLGVLLYELLTGTTPFDKARLKNAAFEEIRRIIREEEPQKPSTRISTADAAPSIAALRHTEPAKLTRLVRGELDWIVMKALEKDRNRRYETAIGFALDVHRYLADEPVQACPPSAGYRVRKFARRNKAALATTALVGTALVLGTVVSTWQAIRATKAEGLAQTRLQAEEQARREAEVARDGEAKQRQLAQENAAEAEGQRRRAEANFAKARQAVDEYLTQITENELLSVPGLQPLREDLLEAALKFYAEFTQERADDPTLKRELAAAHYRLGTIQRDLGNAEAAEAANREAIRLYEQLRDQGQVSVELQAALATAYFFAGRYNDTVTLCQSAMQVEPQHAAVRSLLADTYNQLAVGPNEKKQNVATALKYHQQAFELRESLVRDFAENPRYLAQLGGTVNNLGFILEEQLRLDEALAMYQRGVDYSAQAYERAPHSILWGRWLCTGLRNVARMQVQLDRQDEALRTYERLVTVCRKRAFENPALGSLRGDLYQAYLALGKHQKELGDAAEGARCFRLAREVLEQIPRETPDQLFELATVYAVLARPAESIVADEVDQAEHQHNADLAMATLEKAVEAGYQNDSVLKTSTDLDVLRGRDDFQELLATVQKLAEADRLIKASGTNTAKLSSHQQAADLLKGLGSTQPGSLRHRTTLAATLQSIGVIQTGLKQFEDAEKTLDEVLTLRQELLKDQSNNPVAAADILSTRAAMGQLAWEQDRPQDAHRLWQEILAECQKLAAEHVQHTKLQTEIVGIERSIGDKYGETGLLKLVLPPVERGLKTGQLFDVAGDCRGAHVLAALGRFEDHRNWCQLIAGKWSKVFPAQTVWAATINPAPVLQPEQLLELAERVVKSDLDPLWKFKAATAWYRAGQYERALEVMLAARENAAASGSSACLHWYALVYDKLGQQEVAAKYFDEAEAKYLKSAETSLRGREKSAVKDAHGGAWWTWAEDQAARRAAWIELREKGAFKDPAGHLIQARGYRLIGEQEKSTAEFAAADAATPKDPTVWKARIRLATNFEDAEKAWQRVVEVAGDDPLSWIERGRWYTERGQHEKADADFTKAAELTPDELNKFIEPGWWAATTLQGLAPCAALPMASTPAGATVAAPPIVVLTVPSGQVDFRDSPELKDANTAYAMTYVYSPEAKAVTLLVGGEEPVELRVNGRLVYQWKARSSHYYLDRIPVLLRPGRNTLVARVPNPGRVNSLILRIGDNRLDRGLELAKFGLWDEALTLLKPELVEGQRLAAQVWNYYSSLLLTTGDLAGYREFYHQVLKWLGDKPNSDSALHGSQVCTRAPVPEGDMARLVQLVDEGAAKSPAKGWPANFQFQVYFRAGRYQEVLDRIGTGGVWRSTIRAMCWHHLGDPAKATSDLARAEREFVDLVKMGPEGPMSAKVSNSRNGLLDSIHHYVLLREARMLIAPASTPDDQALHALQAATREQLQAADPRLVPFEMALIRDGNNAQPWLQRGHARAELGEWELAQADFTKAVALARDDPEVLAARCLIYAELDRLEEALADLASLLDEPSNSAQAPIWLAARQRLFDELGQSELFERVTQLRPDDPSPWIGRARYHLSRISQADAPDAEAADKAIADLREAIARGFKDHTQLNTDTLWQTLKSRQDFQSLLHEMADRNLDELLLLTKLEAHTDLVRGVSFLPDGQRLVSIGRDRKVHIWDLQSRSVLSTLPVEGYLKDADVSLDGQLVAVAANANERQVTHVWDLERSERLCELAQDFKWAHCVRLSPDGKRAVTSGNPSSGALWDLTTGKQLLRFTIDGTWDAYTAAFAPDGRLLAFGITGRVCLFDCDSSAPLRVIELTNHRTVEDLAFTQDGARLACSQRGGHISLIDIASGQVIKTLGASASDVASLRLLSNGRFVLAASIDGTLRIWDLHDEKVLTMAAGAGTSKELSVSPNGHFAVTGGGEQWDEESKKWKVNGDYALRLWQLPKSVWPTEPAPSPERLSDEP